MKKQEFEELIKWADENNLPEYLLKSEIDRTPFPVFPRSKKELLNLEKLDLYDWKLEYLHPLVGKLINVRELDIGTNKFKEIPELLFNSESNLEILNLSYCKIKALPTTIGNLTKLRELWAGDTKYLKELPEEICNVKSLERLVLLDSNIKKLPTNVGDLIHLKDLRLSGLYYVSEIPESIGKLKKLEYLSLRRCIKIKSLPESITQLINLKEFSFTSSVEMSSNQKDWIEGLLKNKVNISVSGRSENIPEWFTEMKLKYTK